MLQCRLVITRVYYRIRIHKVRSRRYAISIRIRSRVIITVRQHNKRPFLTDDNNGPSIYRLFIVKINRHDKSFIYRQDISSIYR